MAAHKRKKNTRQRGGTTHGWGAMKKHRGKGNKGGAGMAGTGKRGDAKKPSIWKKVYFGKHGFKKKGVLRKINTINIDMLEAKINKLVMDKKITKEGDYFIIDLKSLGYNKLLGKGKVSSKMKVSVETATQKAKTKISSLGGEVKTLEE